MMLLLKLSVCYQITTAGVTVGEALVKLSS